MQCLPPCPKRLRLLIRFPTQKEQKNAAIGCYPAWLTWVIFPGGQYLSAVAEPLSAAPYDYTTAVEANYPAERARLALLDAPEKYGIAQEEIYTAGYSVYTTIRKDLQKQANLAVRAGILAYDRRHGWRGREQQFEELTESDRFNPDNPAYVKILKNLAEVSSYDSSLEPAIVREVREKSVSVILSDGSAVTLGWRGLEWAAPYISAQKKGPPPKTAADILSVGDMVRITPMQDTENTFQLAQLPAARRGIHSDESAQRQNSRDGRRLPLSAFQV